MIQSDALSRRPDYIPEEDHDNENRILLPENMFVNLMDLDLQNRIANTDKYDFDVKNAMELLLENGPNYNRIYRIGDWKNMEKGISFSTRIRTIFRTIWTYGGTLSRCSMIMKWLDTLVNWKRIIRSSNTIGGLECVHSSKDMFKDVVFANSLKSIKTHPIHRICQ